VEVRDQRELFVGVGRFRVQNPHVLISAVHRFNGIFFLVAFVWPDRRGCRKRHGGDDGHSYKEKQHIVATVQRTAEVVKRLLSISLFSSISSLKENRKIHSKYS
jgi:hypothetical protein